MSGVTFHFNFLAWRVYFEVLIKVTLVNKEMAKLVFTKVLILDLFERAITSLFWKLLHLYWMVDTQCPNQGIYFDPRSLAEDIQYSVKHLYKNSSKLFDLNKSVFIKQSYQ